MSILSPEYIQTSINGEELVITNENGEEMGFDNGLFAFMRFVNVSPMELYRVMLCGWLYA